MVFFPYTYVYDIQTSTIVSPSFDYEYTLLILCFEYFQLGGIGILWLKSWDKDYYNRDCFSIEIKYRMTVNYRTLKLWQIFMNFLQVKNVINRFCKMKILIQGVIYVLRNAGEVGGWLVKALL